MCEIFCLKSFAFNFTYLQFLVIMPKTRDLTIAERSAIAALHQHGHVSLNNLAKQYSIDKRTVMRICAKQRVIGSVENRPRSGRSRITSAREDRLLQRLQRQQPMTTSRSIQQQFFQLTGINIAPRTVRHRMVSFGLKSYIASRKPMLSTANKSRRLAWAQHYSDWTSEQWRQVLFTDEVPISLIQIHQQRHVRCLSNERLRTGMTRPMIHSGGGRLMFWGCFKDSRVGALVEVKLKMKSHDYLNLLKDNLNHDDMQRNNTIMQHDNAPIHKAAVVTTWLREQEFNVLDWPPQSPDLNPIENVWAHVKSELDKQNITSKEMMRQRIQQIWANIDGSFLQKLVDSMPRRVAAVIKNHGGATKY